MIEMLIEIVGSIFGETAISIFGEMAEDKIETIRLKRKRIFLWVLLILDFVLLLAILFSLSIRLHWVWPLSFFGGFVLTTIILILLLIKWSKA